MKKYLLLRNNHESGPHSIETIASLGLLPLDLIWIEGESTAWKYPEEIEELEHLVSKDFVQQERKNVFVSLPPSDEGVVQINEEYTETPVADTVSCIEKNEEQPLPEFRENYRASNQKKPIWSKKIFQFSNEMNVAAVFIGVVLGAIVIKQLVDGVAPTSLEATATAIPIFDREIEKQPDANIKNAIVKEIVPVYKKSHSKSSKPANIKKQLKIETNKYKVGLFGGINDLQLTVFNSSTQFVDRVVVALDYLRPNGVVVQSENVSFSAIKPLGAQTITIPASNRGVKVRYKIIKVSAHNLKADTREV